MLDLGSPNYPNSEWAANEESHPEALLFGCSEVGEGDFEGGLIVAVVVKLTHLLIIYHHHNNKVDELSTGFPASEKTNYHPRKSQYFVPKGSKKTRDCHFEFHSPWLFLQFLSLSQFLICFFNILIGWLEVGINFVEVISLFFHHFLNFLYHLEIIAHTIVDLVVLFRFYFELWWSDFMKHYWVNCHFR